LRDLRVRRAKKGAGAAMRVHEIFASIQGETSRAGLPTVFVRLSGCNLDCAWCDTREAEKSFRELTVEQVLGEVAGHGLPRVCLTGGEPLLEPGLPELASACLDRGWEVSLETNGTRSIEAIDRRVARVVDWKPPSAFVGGRRFEPFCDANFALLGAGDALKLVVADAADLEAACALLQRHPLHERGVEILFSPVHGRFDAARLARALVERRLGFARLNLQLHKVVFGPLARGV
jgi:7-carboxy-7-deazaguanine synthase